MINEKFEAYKIMLKVCFKTAPAMERDDIQCIFSNEFLTTGFLDSLELHNTKLLFNHYQLDLNFQKKLGPHLYVQGKSHSKLVLVFPSKECFDI